MLEVGGAENPVRAISATASQRSGSTRPRSAAGTSGPAPSIATSHEQAIRHGSRAARSPPGCGTASRCPARS